MIIRVSVTNFVICQCQCLLVTCYNVCVAMAKDKLQRHETGLHGAKKTLMKVKSFVWSTAPLLIVDSPENFLHRKRNQFRCWQATSDLFLKVPLLIKTQLEALAAFQVCGGNVM